MQEIKVIQSPSKEKPFVIVQKPSGLFSAPLKENEKNNALFQTAKLFPEILSVSGLYKQIEYGLLHRLDTQTEGLLLIATTQEFYDFLQEEQKNGRFFKYYEANCHYVPNNANILQGFPSLPPQAQFLFLKNKKEQKQDFVLKSFFRNYGKNSKTVRPVLQSSGMAALKKIEKKQEYFTQISLCKENNFETFKAKCKISLGFRHQVRCHLAWCGFPVIGDSLYNSEYKNDDEQLQFRATALEFKNPITNEIEVYTYK